MYEIKKLNFLSVAKIQSFIVMAGYLVWMVLFILLTVLTSSYRSDRLDELFSFDFDLSGLIYGPSILTLLVMLIVVGIIAFISGALLALVYNLIASWIGGIKMDIILTKKKDESQDDGETTQ